MAPEFAYTMHKVCKTYRRGKQVIKDISLSYYYGAKIGVLGLNGSGKSTLLKIMAGVETEFTGDAHLNDGLAVGYLPQEPQLNEAKNVKENVMEGLGQLAVDMARFEEINAQLGDPDLNPDKMEKLLEEQAVGQEKIDSANGWGIEHTP